MRTETSSRRERRLPRFMSKFIKRRRERQNRPEQELLDAAKAAGLRYVSHQGPGIIRKARGKKFIYLDVSGRRIRGRETLARARSLAIPPAYTDVWICPDPRGHLQATGYDARGRKQYRYHPRWREVRDTNKYERMVEFGAVLPMIRRATSRHLALPGLPRDKVLATVVRLLEKTLIRVGNEEYARENKSFGLTTMKNRHVDIKGATIRFEFWGKSKVHHTVDIEDRRLAKIIRNCQEIPGYDLFQYMDDEGTKHVVRSEDVNEYLQKMTGGAFTAKDFRTWAGTVYAAYELQKYQGFSRVTEARRNINQAIESVAQKLGNTKAICRKCYIHPEILQAYLDGELFTAASQTVRARTLQKGLNADEKAVLAFLKRRLRKRALH